MVLMLVVAGVLIYGCVLSVRDKVSKITDTYQVRASRLYRERRETYVPSFQSADPLERAHAATSLASYKREAILFVPYLIGVLGDHTPLQVVKGPPVATELLGNVVGNTTPGGRALWALREITGQDFGENEAKWDEWWLKWWAQHQSEFSEHPKYPERQ